MSTVNDGLTTTVTNNGFTNQATTYKTSENGALESIQFNHSNKNQIIYGYNNDLLASINYGASSLGYSYNINGQLEKLLRNSQPLVSFEYNANGLETATSFGNNQSKIKNNYQGTSNYLQSEEYFTNNVVTPWKTNTYTYDKNGQIIGVSNQSGTTNYEYDSINQLTKETLANGSSIIYTYDVVGNRLTKKVGSTEIKYTYNAVNQLIKVGSQTYTYDDNGNLINDGKYKYTWNAFDQLTEVKTINGTTVATYKYDENGRRIYSKVGTIETYFRYDGTSNLVLFEEDANGTITKEYTYDNHGYPLTLTYNNQTYYYLTNYRGDVLGLTDANGEVVAEYTYDAWGNILAQSGSIASVNPYRYAGYRYDNETKLYYLMARYYNPDTGVFLSLDPVRGDVTNPITMNGYNYASNNPVMNVDPDGENPILFKLLQITVIPILKYLAKRYGPKLMKELNYIVSSNINKYIKKYAKQYNITFGRGNLVSINKKTGTKGEDTRIFSFEYGNVSFMNGKKKVQEKAWHYHLGNPKLHYVFRWNSQYSKGYTFKNSKTHWWVW